MVKFTVERASLSNLLSLISTCVPEGDKGSQTGNLLLLDGKNGIIEVFATSSVASVSTKLRADFAQDFTCTLQYKQLLNLVKLLDSAVEFRVKDGWAAVSCGNSRFRVPSPSPEVFNSQTAKVAQNLRIDSRLLAECLQFVDISTAKDDFANWSLKCINLVLNGGELKLLSCDGKQLSRATVEVENAGNLAFDILLPSRGVRSVLKMLAMDDKEVGIYSGLNNSLQLEKSATILNIRSSAGSFPQAEMIIPQTVKYVLNIGKEELTNGIKRAQMFAKEGGLLKFTFSRENLKISAENVNVGFAEEEFNYGIENLDHPIGLHLYSNQILSCFSQIDSDQVSLQFNTEKLPVLIKPGNSNFGFTYVTMPETKLEVAEENV